MESQYEVLSPWAEADPVPLIGLAPRVSDLNNKKIGLLSITWKHASAPINTVVGNKLKERFPGVELIRFDHTRGGDFDNPADIQGGSRKPEDIKAMLDSFETWLKGVDAVVGAVGD